MAAKQPALSTAEFETFANHVLDGADLCADRQILALADSLHDIIRQRRNARWTNAPHSFDPAPAHELMGAAN